MVFALFFFKCVKDLSFQSARKHKNIRPEEWDLFLSVIGKVHLHRTPQSIIRGCNCPI